MLTEPRLAYHTTPTPVETSTSPVINMACKALIILTQAPATCKRRPVKNMQLLTVTLFHCAFHFPPGVFISQVLPFIIQLFFILYSKFYFGSDDGSVLIFYIIFINDLELSSEAANEIFFCSIRIL